VSEKKEKESNIGRCDRCGKMVVFTKYTLCYECRQDEKAEVDKALAYLKTHRGATLNVVAEMTGVDPKLVLRLIQGGRVEASPRAKESRKKK
jgi:hypothetical protein